MKPRSSPQTGVRMERHVAIRAENLNVEERRVALSISSETEEIRAWDTPQILLHEKSAVNLTRLREIGSVLLNHDPTKIVGRPDNVRLDEKEGKIRADIVFAPTDAGNEAMELVAGGFLRGASVGFKVNKWQRVEDGKSWKSPAGRSFSGPSDIATSWDIFEFSLTPVPADSAVGVGRSTTGREPKRKSAMEATLREVLVTRGLDPNATDEEANAFAIRTMTEPPKPKPEPDEDDNPKPKPPKPTPEEDRRSEAPTEDEVRIAHDRERTERTRCAEIAELANFYPQYSKECANMTREGHSIAQARGLILELLHRDRPAKQSFTRIELGEDHRAKTSRALSDSLMLRAGTLRQTQEESPTAFYTRKDAARDICQASLIEAMKLSLRSNGLSDKGSTDQLITRAFSHSTSDFPAILKDAAEKQLQMAYQEAPSTWRPLAKIGNARNFLPMNRPKFGNMGTLVLTPELVPMAEGSAMDVNESFSIGTYTKRFGISRQALINDDLSAFDRIPTQMGQAAARTVTDTVYALLVSAAGVGPTMAEDSLALFATTHTSGANYIAAVGTPEVTGLSALKKLMRMQKGFVATGETAPFLNITARYLLVPAALETQAMQTVNSIADPSASNDVKFNPFRNLTVIVEPRLDGATNGTTAWYLVADPSQVEGLEVAFLNGQDTPTIVEEIGTNVLGQQWGIYVDFGAKFIEHRGWARTRGA